MTLVDQDHELLQTEIDFRQLRLTQQQALDIEAEIPEDETDAQTHERLEQWYSKWCGGAEAEDEVAVFRRMRSLLGAPSDHHILAEPGLSDKFHSIMSHYAKLLHRLGERSLADPRSTDNVVKMRWGKMLKISESIFQALNAMMSIGKVRLIRNTRSHALLPDHLLAARFMPPEVADVNKYQQLLLFYLQRSRDLQYRKKGAELFKPRLTDTGIYTHSWQRVCDIEDFVYSATYPREHYMEQWKCLSDKPGNAKAAATFLDKVWDNDLPFLVRNKKILAFRNGLFLIDKERFLPFGHPEITHDMTASNFFNVDFEEEKYAKILKTCWCAAQWEKKQKKSNGSGETKRDSVWDGKCTCENDCMKLPTATIDGIFEHQGLGLDVMFWIYAMTGRLFYDVNELDGFQLQMFMKGVAGTGKSSFLRLIEFLFDPSDVGIFNNNVEPNYPLEAIADKHIYLALDIHEGFRLDQFIWQSMVSGEPVSVARKYKNPRMITWKSHGIFAGNGIMKWNNNGDSVARRLMVVPFTKRVTNADPTLLDKMKSEVAPFLKKCVSAYLTVVRKYGSSPIWNVLPDVFKETRKTLQKQTHALEAFLCSNKIRTGLGLEVPLALFTKAFDDFCTVQKLEHKRLDDPDYYTNVFQNYSLFIDPVGGRPYMDSVEVWEDPFLVGVDLVDNIRKHQKNMNAYQIPVAN